MPSVKSSKLTTLAARFGLKAASDVFFCQVRAHRDDWEAERSEKRSAEAALAETEARAALLLQELQLLQAKLADSESKRGLCWRCLCPRTDYNNHRSGSNSAPRTPQASPIPAAGGGVSPAPVVPSAPPPDNPP
ncbi:hypothetical protein SK128_022317, partial [Halocaridina rubra]